MGKTLYLECASGISGDMTVAALLDLGADPDVLKKALNSLKLGGFEIQISRVKKSGLDCCDFMVKLEQDNQDHDMEYLHGYQQDHGHHHEHSHEHNHSHDHSHDHVHNQNHSQGTNHDHSHLHRGLTEIYTLIDGADLTEEARALAKKIFMILAKAEAKAHGVSVEEVHFHEVGAVDSIVDIVAAAVCAVDLGITDTVVSVLCEGRGTVRCQHGVLPIPVPAVVNIAAGEGLILEMTEVQGELITPTGAAIAAALKTTDRLPKRFTVKKVGLGAGKRSYERPSILRAMLIEEQGQTEKDTIYRLESNIDDCTGEQLGYVMECLLKAGARDVNYTPVYMKKNRPAYQLNVICVKEDIRKLEEIIFTETTTIGIRRQEMERTILKREFMKVQTPMGTADVKVCTLPNGRKRFYPEYQSVCEIAGNHHLSFREVYDCVRSHCPKEQGQEKE